MSRRNKRAPITQGLVNAYPQWSSIRTNEQSIGSQLLNTVGNRLQHLNQQVKNYGENRFITTANAQEIDITYKLKLPASFSFEKKETYSEDNPQYNFPIASGLQNDTWYILSGVNTNTLEEFWYDIPPKRLALSGVDNNNLIYDDNLDSIYGGVLQYHEHQSPYIINSGVDIDQPGRLMVEVLSGVSFLSKDDVTGQANRCTVTIAGITRQGVEDTESLVFLHNGVEPTKKDWETIYESRLQNVTPDGTKVRIFNHRFGRNFTPNLPSYEDFYGGWFSQDTRQELPFFWDINTSGVVHKLVLKTYVAEDIRDRINNLGDLKTVREWDLFDSSGNPLDTVTDLTIIPFANCIVVSTETSLLFYDNDWDIPDYSVLNKKTSGAMSVIVPDTYHITLSDQARLEYIWKRPESEVVKHRVWVVAPNGTKYSVENSTLMTYDPTWVFSTGSGRFLRQGEEITLTQRGDWVFNLDVVYKNETQQTDQCIISVDYKEPLVELVPDFDAYWETIVGVDCSPEGIIYILTSADEKFRIDLFYDKMLIDFGNKIIYFRDKFDQVRVGYP